MTAESDRDDLARMFFSTQGQAHWQTWEVTSDGMRAWCRAKADEAMAAGWRKVGEDAVVVRRHDASQLLEWWDEQGPLPTYSSLSSAGFAIADRVRAALADPAGANGGE